MIVLTPRAAFKRRSFFCSEKKGEWYEKASFNADDGVFFIRVFLYAYTDTLNMVDLSEVDFSKQRIREGESCGYHILWLLGPFGDANYKNFILFQKDCVRVYGY